MLSPNLERITVGRMVNGSFLSDPAEVRIRRMGEVGCVRVIDLAGSEVIRRRSSLARLPAVVVTVPERGHVLVRSARALVFNRVAKTGSQSVIELLAQLGRTPMHVELRTVEELKQAEDKVLNKQHHLKHF